MRISDWSSDVCSSDLGAGAAVDEQRLEAFGRLVALQVAVICQVFGRMFVQVGVDVLRCLLAADAETLHQEIGRASCRERVCQYVSISVVAVSLKKKAKCKTSTTQ